MTKPKHKKNSDSKNLDAQKRTRFTERVTLRMDPETKKLLNTFKAKSGITTCQLIHALLTAYFYGVGDKLDLDVKSPTINLTIERRVKRIRRYKREYVEGVTVERWFCALKSREYGWEQLPSLDCPRCPNVKCREHVISRVRGGGTFL